MTDSDNKLPQFRLLSVGLATAAITALFIGMIWDFLIALFLAAIFSAMSAPLYGRMLSLVKGRQGFASALTLLVLYTCVLTPLLLLIYIAAIQANELTTSIVAFVQQLDTQESFLHAPEWLPYREQIESASAKFAAKIGELIGSLAAYLVSAASAVTRGTVSFFLSLFVMTYGMVFFLQEDTTVIAQLMRYSGLSRDAQNRLTETTVAVSRATIKGTLVIGIIQGVLGGLGFTVAGIPGAAFWGIIMAVASVIPGIGPALVWVPGVIYLIAIGSTNAAIGLAIWSALVVSTIDNVLRPGLVGRDTQMPDLIILISTFGGLAMFGAVGLIIGPVVAGLFIAMWDIFQDTVDGALNDQGSAGNSTAKGS